MAGFGIWGAVTFGAVLLLTAMLVHRALRREPDGFVRTVILAGLAAKLVGSAVYFYFLTGVYEGGDSFGYVSVGAEIAEGLRSGTIPETAFATGTRSMEFLSGVLFAVMQAHTVIGFVVFALLAYLGAFLAFRAFDLAFPEGDRRRYAVIVLLFPTMVFWPASLSKDSWLVFTLGVTIYGLARVLRRLPWGYVLVAAGAAGVYLVRPHMGALVLAAGAFGFLLRFRDPDIRRGATAWLVGLVLFSAGAGYVLANFADELLPQDELVADSQLDALLERTQRNTALSGSTFQSRTVTSPTTFLQAVATVPFRPFPQEATNLQSLLVSAEGLVLAGMFLLSVPRLLRLPRVMLRRPYVAFATIYSLGFIVAFANISNFGILARQRSQLLPMLAVLLCLPRTAGTDRPEVASDGAQATAPARESVPAGHT